MVSDDLLNIICCGFTRRLISSNPHRIEVLLALLPVAASGNHEDINFACVT